MSRSASRARGLTLIEVLIALAIIGVTFGVLAVTQVSNLQISAAARDESRATAQGNAIIEEIVACIVSSPEAFETALTGSGCPYEDDERVSYGGAAIALEHEEGGLVAYDDPGGTIRVTVRISEPSPVVFSRIVSCIDVEPPPAIARPWPCPEY